MLSPELLARLSAGPREPAARTDERPIILYHTPWQRRDDSWSIAARLYARTMTLGGLDVRLMSWGETHQELHPETLAEAEPFIRKTDDWDCHVLSCVLSAAEIMKPVLGHVLLEDGPQAFHCVFERLTLEAPLVEQLSRMRGVWAQCSANKQVLEEHGLGNVTLIPMPYFADDPHLRVPAPTEEQAGRLYAITRCEPRKAPDVLVRAFLRAFEPGEATLTIKLSPYAFPGAYPSIEEILYLEQQVSDWTEEEVARGIKVIRAKLSAEEMVDLHARHGTYVSASRGEGLDMPIMAAKLAGRRVVTTDSGGPRDLLGRGDFLVPATGRTPAHPAYYWGEGAAYADHDVDALADAMREARYFGYEPSRLSDQYRAENVAPKFRAWVEELCS